MLHEVAPGALCAVVAVGRLSKLPGDLPATATLLSSRHLAIAIAIHHISLGAALAGPLGIPPLLLPLLLLLLPIPLHERCQWGPLPQRRALPLRGSLPLRSAAARAARLC